ncbi:HlyD family efflux transporter periplasmic adaptor subunit [Streptomyces sp. JJ38]|uniref:HlyD family efflux transporter periplasmic adaptor subunit n=1 Tax=Streptomyces sp. JJ38 TaxID=2738128 RepID=UPI001C5689AB|nr:HlyD family efflux transporter periplasmic adaptor subunit [Streptomyces sp. JJ38]MBW1597076.1 HlyD family efflux transporter periplasmic adaptor subunit [Streptomyces sp. JJ38]
MQFRQKAYAKFQAPEALDLPVRFARPQGLLVLLVTLAVMVGATVWGMTGSVSAKLDAVGVLTHARGAYVLQSPVAGQVTGVLAEEGDLLRGDAPLLRVRTAEGEHVVRTVAPGRVQAVTAEIGAVVTPGRDVATLQRVESADEPLVAVLYVPGGKASGIPDGARVDLAVRSVPREEFGVLRGRITAVGRAPRTVQQLAGFLGDATLAEQFAALGGPVAVTVTLERSERGESGYRWSRSEGPPFPVEAMTLTDAAVHLPDQRPVDWLFA